MNRDRVLVVDDDQGVVDLWVEVLEREGFEAIGRIDPLEALDLATREGFDLVLCDVEMPGLRGPALLERLLEVRPGQLVVLITAFGTIQAAVDALRSGAADFVSKPCGPETLIHTVRRALRERRLRREVVRETLGVSAAGWRWIHAWHWPGNVRELFNRLEGALPASRPARGRRQQDRGGEDPGHRPEDPLPQAGGPHRMTGGSGRPDGTPAGHGAQHRNPDRIAA